MATLNKATAYIFTDMQTAERHGHAGECYETTAKRCAALLQWINMVRILAITLITDLCNTLVTSGGSQHNRQGPGEQ